MKRFFKFIFRPNQRLELYFVIFMHLIHSIIIYQSFITNNYFDLLKEQSTFLDTLFWSMTLLVALVPIYYWTMRVLDYKKLLKQGLA